MKGRVSSLNLAVAAGVLLYQFMEKKSGRELCASWWDGIKE
jgi:tRNA G18 (ribose-2'-O)-methylase SpoU